MHRVGFALIALVAATACQGAEVAVEEPAVDPAPAPSEPAPPPEPPGFEDGWDYGPVVIDSDDLDYLPVDPEAIVLPDGRVRMWVDEGGGGSMLRTLTSTDGVTFVPDDVPLIPGNFPSVVALADGRYRMYVVRFDPDAGDGGLAQVHSLVSDDALTWTEEEGVRFVGLEPSAAILADGRTLLAVRRVSTREPDPLWCSGGSAIWFAVSEDGVTFEEVGEAIDGVTASDEYRLDGRLYGVELARLSTGELVLHVEGCLAGFLAEIDEASLTLGPLRESRFRGRGPYDAYEFLDASGAPDPTRETFVPDGIAGAGGDITLVVLGGRDVAYIALLDRFDHASQGAYDAARQRIAQVLRAP